jgi:hypothetical protein
MLTFNAKISLSEISIPDILKDPSRSLLIAYYRSANTNGTMPSPR